MKRGMRLVLITAVLVISSVSASAAIQSINATDLISTFSPTGGAFGKGVLSIDDIADIVVENTLGVQTTFDNGTVAMVTSLQFDDSVGGIAEGTFVNGTLSFLDNVGGTLLSGSLESLKLKEVVNGLGIIAGGGAFMVTGGSLQADFGYAYGDIVQITFQVNPITIGDFKSNFSAGSNLTITPIVPEPATIMMLGLGALGLLRKRK